MPVDASIYDKAFAPNPDPTPTKPNPVQTNRLGSGEPDDAPTTRPTVRHISKTPMTSDALGKLGANGQPYKYHY